jgi:alkylation response protein AidB-like acyl-CoA dehydrogenase
MGPKYNLDGFKWFSSATDSDVAVALARTGSPSDGSRALSLFFLPLRLPLLRKPGDPTPSSTSNGILVHRLKDKIGTHALPTAELSLNSTEAYLVGPLNKGIKTIVPVLNITRVHSAITSVGFLRKCLAIATSYATVRTIHDPKKNSPQSLSNTPLHVAQLASINLIYRALTHLVFGAVRLLGKTECHHTDSVEGGNSSEGRRLRILTPVVKAFAAEKCVGAMEECMSAMGGAGYMEENGIGRAIRDALVEKIWEGTITVLSLDLVRATKDVENIAAFVTVSFIPLACFLVFNLLCLSVGQCHYVIVSFRTHAASQTPN